METIKRNLTQLRAQKTLYYENVRDLLIEQMETAETLLPQFNHEEDLYFIGDDWEDMADIMRCLQESWEVLQDIAKEEQELLQEGKEVYNLLITASVIADDCQAVLDMNPCQEVRDAITDLLYPAENDLMVYSQKLANILGDEYVDFDLID